MIWPQEYSFVVNSRSTRLRIINSIHFGKLNLDFNFFQHEEVFLFHNRGWRTEANKRNSRGSISWQLKRWDYQFKNVHLLDFDIKIELNKNQF